MYESFASRTPFISTPVGNVIDYKNIVKIVDSEEEMADIATELLNNKDIMKHMADVAFNEWINKYTWDKISLRYEEVFSKLVYGG